MLEGTAVDISVLLLSDILLQRDFEITLTAKSNGTYSTIVRIIIYDIFLNADTDVNGQVLRMLVSPKDISSTRRIALVLDLQGNFLVEGSRSVEICLSTKDPSIEIVEPMEQFMILDDDSNECMIHT